jgi:hypothetical protein
MTSRLVPGLIVLLFGVQLSGAAAQQATEARLTRAEARHSEPFSSITGLLPLPDGRVLVTDGIDETFLRLDLRTSKTDTIGRKGAGPGEYTTPDALFAIENGQTLLVDLGNGRLSIFDATGKYRQSIPIARGQPGLGLTILVPRGADGQGRLYFQPGGPGGGADSGAVVRYDRTGEKMDTLVRIGLPATEVSSSGGAGNRSVSVRPVPLSPADAWAVAPDGRLAVARSAGYRIEWIHPDGRVVRGPSNTVRSVSIREADKKEWLEEMANGLSVQVMAQNGRMNVRLGRGGARPRDPDPSQFEWPATKPPFTGRMWISVEGNAWVERSVPAGQPRVYDVFGSDGRLQRAVILPVERRVLGFGPGVVYVQHTDADDGLQYLERYRIP